MRAKIFLLSLLLMGIGLNAKGQTTYQEIPLYEVEGFVTIGLGDQPNDGPGIGDLPTDPTRFRASISQRIHSVTSLVSAGAATIAVFDHHGELVCYEHRIFHSPNIKNMCVYLCARAYMNTKVTTKSLILKTSQCTG